MLFSLYPVILVQTLRDARAVLKFLCFAITILLLHLGFIPAGVLVPHPPPRACLSLGQVHLYPILLILIHYQL
jgi:hypothetical protein